MLREDFGDDMGKACREVMLREDFGDVLQNCKAC